MTPYLALVEEVLNKGRLKKNRTGVDSISLPGAMLRFDLRAGFPAVTTKKLAFRAVVGELIGFLRGLHNAADFRALGCRVWDQNANENTAWLNNPYRAGTDDLGSIYGVQWRSWPAYKCIPTQKTAHIQHACAQGFQPLGQVMHDGVPHVLLYKAIDQIRACLDEIVHQPDSRRILFHGWNCAALDSMALPPCHLLYQFLPEVSTRHISLCLYVRSNDLGLGAPFNIAQAAVLLHLVGRLTGYTPEWLSYFIGDAHIYESHRAMLETQCKRRPYPLPELVISERVPAMAKTQIYAPEFLETLQPEDFSLKNYQHHSILTAPMAV